LNPWLNQTTHPWQQVSYHLVIYDRGCEMARARRETRELHVCTEERGRVRKCLCPYLHQTR